MSIYINTQIYHQTKTGILICYALMRGTGKATYSLLTEEYSSTILSGMASNFFAYYVRLLFMLFSGCATISAGNNTWLLMSDYSYSIILSCKSKWFTIYVIYALCYHFSW